MWQRWNQSTHIFEKSTDNGGSWTPLGLNASIITEGTLADARLSSNVPLLNAPNTWTQYQYITCSNARMRLTETGSPVNHKVWDILNYAERLRFWAESDDYQTYVPTFELDRVGNAILYGSYFERNRGYSIGQRMQWTPTVTTREGAAVSAAVTYGLFSVIGNILWWSIYSQTINIPAITTGIRYSHPPGFNTVADQVDRNPFYAYVPGVGDAIGYSQISVGNIEFLLSGRQWPAGQGNIVGQGFYYLAG